MAAIINAGPVCGIIDARGAYVAPTLRIFTAHGAAILIGMAVFYKDKIRPVSTMLNCKKRC